MIGVSKETDVNKKSQAELNRLEDADTSAPRPPKRTLAQAVEYAKAQGYVWIIWGGRWLTIPEAESLK